MERNNKGASGGIGFCGALAIAFIVLKLLKTTNREGYDYLVKNLYGEEIKK